MLPTKLIIEDLKSAAPLTPSSRGAPLTCRDGVDTLSAGLSPSYLQYKH